jgi:hypothetical protein
LGEIVGRKEARVSLNLTLEGDPGLANAVRVVHIN